MYSIGSSPFIRGISNAVGAVSREFYGWLFWRIVLWHMSLFMAWCRRVPYKWTVFSTPLPTIFEIPPSLVDSDVKT